MLSQPARQCTPRHTASDVIPTGPRVTQRPPWPWQIRKDSEQVEECATVDVAHRSWPAWVRRRTDAVRPGWPSDVRTQQRGLCDRVAMRCPWHLAQRLRRLRPRPLARRSTVMRDGLAGHLPPIITRFDNS